MLHLYNQHTRIENIINLGRQKANFISKHQVIFKVSAIGRVKVLVAEVGLDAFEALPGNDAVEVVPGVPAQLSLMRDIRCCQKPFTSDAQFLPQDTKRAHACT